MAATNEEICSFCGGRKYYYPNADYEIMGHSGADVQAPCPKCCEQRVVSVSPAQQQLQERINALKLIVAAIELPEVMPFGYFEMLDKPLCQCRRYAEEIGVVLAAAYKAILVQSQP